MSGADTQRMKAVCAVDGRAELVSVTRPTPRPGMAIVRPTAALLTPLEREVVRGLGSPAGGARVLGHAFVGVIEALGANTSDAPGAGTRVAVLPVFSCGRCARCEGGLPLHCEIRTIAGIDAAAGGLAEAAEVPVSACVPIPAGLDDERAVFAAPLARAIEAVRRGGVDRRTYASILGDDILAVLAALVAVEQNPLARLVAAQETTLRTAEQFGIRHRALADTGLRGDQELVIDSTGSVESIAAAARMARARGHVVVAGISARSAVAVDLSTIALDELELHGSGFGPLGGAIARLAQRAVDPSPLVSRRVGLTDAPRALALLAEPGVLSVLVQVTR